MSTFAFARGRVRTTPTLKPSFNPCRERQDVLADVARAPRRDPPRVVAGAWHVVQSLARVRRPVVVR
eukprot:2569900-Alexandrium_andersonii.AAC.1